jgi:hypothetical protein
LLVAKSLHILEEHPRRNLNQQAATSLFRVKVEQARLQPDIERGFGENTATSFLK